MQPQSIEFSVTAKAASTTPLVTLIGVTICVGVGAGLGGMLLALLLHFVQHVAYGYGMGELMRPHSFLEGVTASTPMRRVVVLLICGCLAGVGWWILYRWARPLISINEAIKADDPRMPIIATGAHALLQIITVALGSPLGREVAPRELGATFAGWLAHRTGLTAKESQVMVACGAGAGLAAVYNVPLGGALFVLEVLLGTFSPSMVVLALVTSVIGAMVAWIGLGNHAQYAFPEFEVTPSLVIWSILMGPVFGFFAYWFSRLTVTARRHAPRDWRLIPWCIAILTATGLVAIAYPEVLGNGKGPLQLGFDDAVGVPLAGILLALKVILVVAVLRAGARGGRLTPSMAIGALLAIVIGGLWNQVFPIVPPGAFAIVGAAAFLAAVMRMPITAVVLVYEFTHVSHDFLLPIIIAVAGSTAALSCCIHQEATP